MKQTAARVAFLLLLIASSHSPGEAQQSEATSELWPEIDVYVPLGKKFRLVIVGSITKLEETRRKQELQIGGRLDYFAGKKIVLGAGYSFRHSPGDGPSNENRVLAEQTFRHMLPLKILASDRNREEIRNIDGDWSFRYRNRLTLEREFRIRKRSVTPYASFEVFHDSRFGVWNRNRLLGGVQLQLKRAMPLLDRVHPRHHVVLEPYYARQNDSRSQPSRIHAIGLTLSLYF